MLYRKIIAVCSEIHTDHVSALCNENLEHFSVENGGSYCNLWLWRLKTRGSISGYATRPPRHNAQKQKTTQFQTGFVHAFPEVFN